MGNQCKPLILLLQGKMQNFVYACNEGCLVTTEMPVLHVTDYNDKSLMQFNVV